MKSPSVDLKQTDWQSLLTAARNGDDSALGEICERLRDYLHLAAASDLGKDLTPKLGPSDIVQATMLEACRDFHTFLGNSEAEYRSWIRRLLKRNLVDSARRYRQAQSRSVGKEVALQEDCGLEQFPGQLASPSSLLSRQEMDELLLQAIARLPANQQQVIELRHRQGLSYPEISAKLGMTETAVRKLWSRAVQKLSHDLTQAHGP